ncbi:MAG: WD40 repeat domain-containing protein [Thermoguttaceae bacterium]
MSNFQNHTPVNIGQRIWILPLLLLVLTSGCAGIFRGNQFVGNRSLFRTLENENEEKNAISLIRVSPDGTVLAVGYAPPESTTDGPTQKDRGIPLLTQTVKIWSFAENQPKLLGVRELSQPNRLKMEFQPDGKMLVLAEETGLSLLDPTDPESIRSAPFRPLPEQKVRFLSRNGKWIVTISPQGIWTVLDVRTLERRITLPEEINQVLSVSSSGKLIAVRQKQSSSSPTIGPVSIWDISENRRTGGTLSKLSEIPADFEVGPELCQFTPDENSFVLADQSDDLQVWNVRTGKTTSKLGHHARIRQFDFALHSYGNRLAVDTFEKKTTLQLWSKTEDGNGTWDCRQLKQEKSQQLATITAISFNRDGSTLYAGDSQGNLELWKITE